MIHPLEKMRSQVRAFHLLLSPTQVVHNHIHPPTTPTSFFSLCPFSCKVIFKLPGSKPGVITDSVPQGAHVHTHTPTLPNQAVLRCLSAHSPLLLSASSFSIVTTLTQALHTCLIAHSLKSGDQEVLSTHLATSKGQV